MPQYVIAKPMKPPANKPASKIATIKKAERGLRFGGGGEKKRRYW
jgi:hypothetical protein